MDPPYMANEWVNQIEGDISKTLLWQYLITGVKTEGSITQSGMQITVRAPYNSQTDETTLGWHIPKC